VYMVACTSGLSQDGSQQVLLTVSLVALSTKLLCMQKSVEHCSHTTLTEKMYI